jgi:hypothetical protein
MARGLRNLTTDHFSWLYDTGACVDGCPAPCARGSPRLFVTDDQFALVPSISADAYFNAYAATQNASASKLQEACGTRFSPGLEYVQAGRLTCALIAGGVRFEPFSLRAVLSPLIVHRSALWDGVVLPEHPIQKDCS